MHRRQWDATTNTLMVLEGLKGNPVAEICTEHESSQSLSYQWRDHVLATAAKAVEGQQQGRREARLGRENARLKKRVGELLLERNTSDELLG